MNRFICIHGHFYQPPRENPWIEEVEVEDSAFPYHDWNDRITAECYAPNTASRILDSGRKIVDIVNNYAAISFDFGPTLLTWLERNNPEVYSAVIDADRMSRDRFSGHGSAIAQAYNHIIMPLANRRDKTTQIIWGIRDFRHRFGRMPEGMWLPETAVDYETLEIMAGQGILFTILSPSQAAQVRTPAGSAWTDVRRDSIDCSQPYTCVLPGGKTIAVFFYDDALAQELAFSNLLDNGEVFARRILHTFSRFPQGRGLASVASDGETFGHHHRFADMALAYALYRITKEDLATITIFGEYLAAHPPVSEVRIRENTSWSCPHGIERWRSDCGCSTRGTLVRDSDDRARGAVPEKSLQEPHASFGTVWHMAWRSVLRSALDQLRDELIPVFETGMKAFVNDPWEVRDDYIGVILDRSPASAEQFFARHATRALTRDEKTLALKMLEMQRHAMLMYTSCGWFFDDISGIETLQVMRYACRAMQLAREITGTDHEPAFIAALTGTKSNIPEQGDGAAIYRNYVQKSVIEPSRVVFNYALRTLIDGSEPVTIHWYKTTVKTLERTKTGDIRMLIGVMTLRSEITGDEITFEFAVLQMHSHDFIGGVRPFTSDEEYFLMKNRIRFALQEPDTPRLITTIEKEFGPETYSLWHLFKDAQRDILFRLMDSTLRDLESSFRQIFRQHFTLIHAMQEMQIPIPGVIGDPVRYILNRDLRQALLDPILDIRTVSRLVNEMLHGQFPPDRSILDYTASIAIGSRIAELVHTPDDIPAMQEILALFRTLAPLNLQYDLWKCQNDYFYSGTKQLAAMKERAEAGDAHAAMWVSLFHDMGKWLGVNCA